METKPIKAKDVAQYLLSLSRPDCGDIISNLKLQKLLYYCQGFHLALYGEPFFEESFEKWSHGPAIPELYREYDNKFGSGAIDYPQGIDISFFTLFNEQQKDLMAEIYTVFGQFSALKLEKEAHQERPWKEVDYNEIIPRALMMEYFKTQLVVYE